MDLINYYSGLANIATIIVLLFAGWQFVEWKKKRKSELKHIMGILKSHVKVVSSWASLKGGGYHKKDQQKTIKKNFKIWGNPFHQVFEMDKSINLIPILPGIEKLGSNFNQALANLNQEIVSFNSYLRDIG